VRVVERDKLGNPGPSRIVSFYFVSLCMVCRPQLGQNFLSVNRSGTPAFLTLVV
jgi:hypothetical protein